MLIQKVSRTNAEKIFIVCQNGTGATLTTGMGARFIGGIGVETASADGVQVIALDAGTAGQGNMYAFAGIADQDVKSLGYGRFQAWGYCNSIMMSGSNASVTADVLTKLDSFLQPGAVAGTWWSSYNPTMIFAISTGLSTAPIMQYTKYVNNMITSSWSTQTYGAGGGFTSGFVRAI
jgi:hypothetical protein